MTTHPTVDTAWAAQLATFCKASYDESMAPDGSAIGQVGYVLAADCALDCAMVTHALGAEPDDVRTWIKRAAFALGEVFRLRGTTAASSVAMPDSTGHASATACIGADFSLTNPRRGLLAMQVALVAGDAGLVRRIAARVGHDSDAALVGPDSVVCTTEEEGLAKAMKALLLDQTAVATFHTAGLAQASPAIRAQAVAIDALVCHDRHAFLAVLGDLLEAHAEAARAPENAREPRCLVAMPLLALASMAMRLALIEAPCLPDDPYLPRALLPPL